MTREEAKTILKNAAWLGTHEDRDKVEQAVEMAIQALENHDTFMKYAYSQGKHDALSQEPTVTSTDEPMTMVYPTIVCDDAISREDAEQMFRNIRSHLKPQDYKSAEEFNTRDLMLLNAEQMIHALPSVTQKSGKWNEYYTSQKGNDVFNCKECGHTFVVTQGKDNMNYCPNCGAKMESEE